MTSLEQEMKGVADLELAVCFFHNNTTETKFVLDRVTYYPIHDNNKSFFDKVVAKLSNTLTDHNLQGIKDVINDFKPDVIQLFGTESGLGEIIAHTNIPVVTHLQGLINPYVSAWFPKGISKSSTAAHSKLRDVVFLRSLNKQYEFFVKMASREAGIIRSGRYFFGRTEWDERMVRIFNHKATYYHCDELLRRDFFINQWESSPSALLKIVTIVKPNMYKGLEMVLEAASILKKNTSLTFQWVIIGANQNSQAVLLFEKVKNLKFADQSIVFKGGKDTAELIKELKESDLFIHPSHIDNSPNSVCEAMLLGMPVIAGRVGGVPSLITHNENGLLYNSHDPFELAGIILENAKDPAGLQLLGKNARETALQRHDPKTIVSTILSTYKKMMQESAGQHSTV